MPRLIIRTPRLELIAAEPDVALAEAAGTADWWRALSVPAPSSWPPPLNDVDSVAWFARNIADDPSALGWFTWYVVHPQGVGRALIGSCGFKGRPDTRGSVEIGYGLLADHQRQGFGTELTSALVGWAFGHPPVARVLAETLPQLVGSVRVLEKNGFQLLGRGSTQDTILFELRRTVFEQRARHAIGAGRPQFPTPNAQLPK
jgi:RimJ/RimL family protein N-acetyltransferase